MELDRVRHHFNHFGLGSLYAAQAAQELANIAYRLEQLREPVAVQGYLEEEAGSRRRARLNSWQHAMYAALSESVWFCSEGFQQIA